MWQISQNLITTLCVVRLAIIHSELTSYNYCWYKVLVLCTLLSEVHDLHYEST